MRLAGASIRIVPAIVSLLCGAGKPPPRILGFPRRKKTAGRLSGPQGAMGNYALMYASMYLAATMPLVNATPMEAPSFS